MYWHKPSDSLTGRPGTSCPAFSERDYPLSVGGEQGQQTRGHPRGVDHEHLPGVDESRDCLHRAGWSVGEIATATRWLVFGTNGENQLLAEAAGQAEAWHRACEQAAAVGMLAPARPEAGRDRGAVLP
jgi:hypothetical protein